MKKISIAAALLALVMIFAGCSLVELNYERDMAQTVIKVDGQEVTKAEYANNYYHVIQTYMYFRGYTLKQIKDPKTASDIKESAINATIANKIMEIKAGEYGCYEFTQDDLDDIQAQYDDFIDSYRKESKAKIEGDEINAGLSQEELDALIEEDYLATLEGLGFEEETYMQGLKDQKAVEKLKAIITEADEPTESEIQSAYNAKVAEQKQAFIEGTSDYVSMVSGGYSTIYYHLPDTRKVKHILIGFPEEVQAQINQLRDDGDDAGADLLIKEELAKIKDEADEVYALAKDGADFDELIAEYGDDPGMEDSDTYVVVKGNSKYVKEFTDGVYSLENVGDITQPISSDFGYHIILYAEAVPEGAVPLDQVKDELKETLIADEKNELYSTQLDEWRDQMKIRVYKSRMKIDLE